MRKNNNKILLVTTAITAVVILISSPAKAAEVATFPSLDIAKAAYKDQNYVLAAQHWMPLAHKGNPQAQVELGKLYNKGLGVKQNNQTALNLFLSAADKNNSRAMFEIGRLYEKGDGVDKDIIKAKEWYELASLNGYARGNFAIGSMYEKNKFSKTPKVSSQTKTNVRTAVNNIKNHQYEDAYYLASLYEHGNGVQKSAQRALTYYLVAQQTGQNNLQAKISYLESKLGLDQYMQAKKNAAILLSNNKITKEPRKELIRSLKSKKTPAIPDDQVERNQELAQKYYETSAIQGYKRAETKISNVEDLKFIRKALPHLTMMMMTVQRTPVFLSLDKRGLNLITCLAYNLLL